ncbi:MAG: hypothetical protein JRJ66_12605 [Deltaproteobacteria bacterium]|nr:hypothetical protein [Deltaproteobacteria bacterium]
MHSPSVRAANDLLLHMADESFVLNNTPFRMFVKVFIYAQGEAMGV